MTKRELKAIGNKAYYGNFLGYVWGNSQKRRLGIVSHLFWGAWTTFAIADDLAWLTWLSGVCITGYWILSYMNYKGYQA